MELIFWNCKPKIPRQYACMEVGAGIMRPHSPARESQRRPHRAAEICAGAGRASRCLHSRQREQYGKGKGPRGVSCLPVSTGIFL